MPASDSLPASVPEGRALPRRRAARGVALAVLAAHALLLGGALRLTVWRDRQPTARETPPLVVQLLNLRPPAQAATPASPATARATAPGRRPPARREPQAITLPAAPATEATAPAPPSPSSATPAAAADAPASAPAPLDLRLPRGPTAAWRARNPALDDPRSNTARPATVDSRIAALLGGVDGIVEERLDDGRMRFRRGTGCVVVHPNRAERIDPFNASAYPKLRGAESC